MSDSLPKPWSDNPYAPKISRHVYLVEKNSFGGVLTSLIPYGMLIVLLFKCMATLFSPGYRRGEGIKWGLVSYTVVMFSLVTIVTAMNLHITSIGFIGNREFTGVKGVLAPGPMGYMMSNYFEAINMIPNSAYLLNNWLADGFLLYRCYVIYSMNLWFMAFPCLIFLGSVATGILTMYPILEAMSYSAWSGIPYLSISLSLNIILTLMIVGRLVLHGRNVRAATGSPAGISGLYKTIATMLIESSALFAVNSLLVIGTSPPANPATSVFTSILGVTQVIAPLLIIQRVANKSALTSDTLTGTIGSSGARTRWEFMGGSRVYPDDYSMGPVDERGTNPGELGGRVGTANDFRQDGVEGPSKSTAFCGYRSPV